MGLLTNPLVVVIKLEATKCYFRLLHFCPLCDVLRGHGSLRPRSEIPVMLHQSKLKLYEGKIVGRMKYYCRGSFRRNLAQYP